MSAPADVTTRPEARVAAPFVVCVFNQKGGVGKSLLSMGLAAVTADTKRASKNNTRNRVPGLTA